MTVYELTTAILIGLGACALLFSLHGTMKILGILKFNRYRTSWLVLAVLSAFFLVGYLAVIHFIVAGHFEYLKLFAGLIFFFGAIYVFIVVRTGHLTIKDLTNTKSFADNVVNSMSGCLFLMNPRLEVVKINRATLDLTGYAEGEILGKSINDFIVASGVEDGQYLKCTVENIGKIKNRELSCLSKDGGRVPILVSCSSVRDVKGAIESIICVCLDLTDRKKAAEEKERLSSQLYQADKMSTVGQLAAGVAHEINNPISFLLPNMDFLREGFEALQAKVEVLNKGGSARKAESPPGEDEIDEAIEEIPVLLSECEDGLKRIKEITGELRQFSHNDDIQVEEVQLSDLVESCLTIANNAIKYKARVVRNYADIPDIVVSRGKLSQVFLNIIVNAAQAVEEGQVEDNWIKVSTYREHDEVVVEIANSGKPIPAEIMPKIFDPFFTTKPRGQGTGLGMSISYSLVQQHGGHIEVDSSAEKGTAFRVILPTNTGLVRKEEPEIDHERKASGRAGRILVVDDEQGIVRYMRRILRNHEVVAAEGGRRALELLKEDQGFDVVFCDLMMPDVTGMEVFEEVAKSYPELSDQFVFITGGTLTSAANKFMNRIENPKFEKPLGRSEILKIVDDAICRLDSCDEASIAVSTTRAG